jgi:hypothetical protein
MVTPFSIHLENGTWTNQSEITVNGTVEPGSRLVLRVADQQGNFTGNGTTLNISFGNFSVNITLQNGNNLILVEAFDGFGNSAAQFINVTMDNTPPLINLSSPSSLEYFTNQARLDFTGTVEQDASVFLNGRVVLVNDGVFDLPKTLQPGPNLFVLTAFDRAGNVRTMSFNITFDRTPPMLVIKSPRDRSTTTGSSILVRGNTEAGATITMNGRPARPDASGNFKGQVPLRMGHNSIDIVATDLAGNQATEHLVVDRAQAPPLLYDWQIGLLTVAIVVCVFVGIVAWDTRRTTGTWALKRPAWLRVPERVRGYIPRPVFGREEFDSGPRAVSGASGKKVGEPAEHGTHPQGAPAGPPARPAEPLPAASLGDEFIVSEKPLSVQSGTMPAATEVPAQLPVAEPSGTAGGPAGDTSAAPGPAAPAGGQPAPVVHQAPAGQPAAPPKPEEPDPLAEILGHPTKKI